MSEVYLGKLSLFQADWASYRQAVISGNIANANTVGYKAADVVSFESALAKASNLDGSTKAGIAVRQDAAWDVLHSGTAVNLANEMIKAGETVSALDLNTSVMKSFHRMVVSAFGS
ncbi:MAG: flagellar basal body rod protein FlgB [Nitratireductor sp.]|nr:flagellar basal body rod protein FlgB [Nitratireductor sp.]MCC0019910.1 flagellar basal body rod protein FlgB [Nitratireductor sp.]